MLSIKYILRCTWRYGVRKVTKTHESSEEKSKRGGEVENKDKTQERAARRTEIPTESNDMSWESEKKCITNTPNGWKDRTGDKITIKEKDK